MSPSKKYPKDDMVGSLFSGNHAPTGWVAPAELPDFSQIPLTERFGFDTEFELPNKNIYRARLAGMSICDPLGKRYYLPVGHRAGGNLDENAVRRWAKGNLRSRHLSILNAKGDIQVCHSWGLDLEELDVKVHDPAFKAALLDENRRRFNLNQLSNDILGIEKEETKDDKSNIADMAASEVGSYAEHDAFLHRELDTTQQKDIDSQGLTAVCELEDQLIYSTVAMERAGARIDRPKLERWIKEVEEAHQSAILSLYAQTGVRVNPNSGPDLKRLFNVLGLEYPRREEELGGDITFEEEYLRRIQHPCVRAILLARKLHSLLTKYLIKYRNLLDANNILRYQLHQLRSDEFGTVTGRYASSGGKEKKGINVQQVMKVESQLEEYEIAAWIIRELFIPDDGKLYVSADASQIEFRWFAHYSKSDRLIADYCKDPTMDFHQLVADLLGQKRKDAKHNNFGKLYTMGIPKLARKLGCPCNCGVPPGDQWCKANHRSTCAMQRAFAISKEYDEKFPEAKKLSQEAMRVAKNRGYVHTVMGRRRRYPTGERLHSALNAIIQGTAADTLKVKLLETYRNRKFLTMVLRATVHDEIDGDIEDRSKSKDFKELLEAPDARIPCRVPLLWQVSVGENWRRCTE
jgi:DNA polymerase-1